MTGLDGAWFDSTPFSLFALYLSVCVYIFNLYGIINAIWTAEKNCEKNEKIWKRVKRGKSREKFSTAFEYLITHKSVFLCVCVGCCRTHFPLIHSINLLNCSLFFSNSIFFIFFNETKSKQNRIVWAHFVCMCVRVYVYTNRTALFYLLLLRIRCVPNRPDAPRLTIFVYLCVAVVLLLLT